MRTLKTITDHDLAMQRKAMSETALAQRRLEAMDVALTKERQAREKIDRYYRNRIAAGHERLLVGLRKDQPSSDARVSGTASVGNGASTVADIDPATAQRIFEMARDDETEIEKLRALQGYVCAIRPHTPNCDAILKWHPRRKEGAAD
ncbi:lysis system i-spanin subunit Rz [Paraburkholderia azotifigens]|uniref:lysis system i-spanin subunit Rz n=1 Tax=Paraburkholderia azotifigens TaxID=2057004 RepID=UPI00316EACA4